MRGTRTALLVVTGAVLLCVHAAFARNVSFSVYYTADFSGILNRSWNDGRCGGVVPGARALERARRDCPESILVDCGNFYGSGYDSRHCSRATLSKAMCVMGYDAWLPGRSEWRCDDGKAFVASEVPMLGANFRVGDSVCRPYVLKDVGGIRVAVIGLVDTDGARLQPRNSEQQTVAVSDCVDALGRIMPEIREAEPAVVVLAISSSVIDDGTDVALVRRLIRCFPEIDLVLTDGNKLSRRIGTALYASVPLDAECMGQIQVGYDTTERIVTGMDVTRVRSACGQLVQGELLYDVLAAEVEAAQRHDEKVIGVFSEPLVGTNGESGESAAGRFLGKAIAAELDCDISFFQWPVGSSLNTGNVCVRDVYSAFPDQAFWGVLLLTPGELKTVVEETMMAASGTDKQLGFYGFSYVSDGNDSLSRIRLLDGAYAHPRKRYRVAVPRSVLESYDGAYDGVRALVEEPLTRCEFPKVDIYGAVINYISQHLN